MKFEFNRKEYERKYLDAGGYVGKIVNVSVNDETISVYFDIAEGEFKNIYTKEHASNGGTKKFDSSKWNKKGIINFNFQYSGAKYAFAQFLDDLESSNQIFKWNDETDDLKNKFIGVVYKKNIYTDKFGDIKEGIDFPEFTSVKVISENKYSIEPRNKKESSSKESNTTMQFDIKEDDIEF